MRRTRIILTLLVLALLVTACGGAAPPAAPSSSGSGATDKAAAAPAPKPTAGAAGNAATEGKSVDPERWAKVKAWKGTISVTNTRDGEEELDLGEIRMVASVKLNNSADGGVAFDEFVELDDTELAWMPQYESESPANISIDETVVTKTYNKSGELENTESGTTRGEGEGTVSYEASGLNIHLVSGTYDVGFSAGGLEVAWSTKMELPGGYVTESSGTKIGDGVTGGAVDNPLPTTGSRLTGSKPIDNDEEAIISSKTEGTITWDLEAVW